MRLGPGIYRGTALAIGLLLSGAVSAVHAQPVADKHFRKTAEAARSSLQAGDTATARFHLSQLSPDSLFETYVLRVLQLEITLKQGDILAQRSAVARVIESGGVPQERLGYFNYLAGYLSYQTGAIDNAVIYLERARALGTPDPKALLMLAESYVRQRKIAQASSMVEEAITAQESAGQPVPASWYDRAASLAYKRKNWSDMARYSAASLKGGGATSEQWRSALTSYGANTKPHGEARLDLYRLQALTGALASERDYHDYAQLAADLGYAIEAKTVLEAGQGAGALLSSDPVARALTRKIRRKSIVQLSAIKELPGKAGGATTALMAMKNGDSLFASSHYVQAISYYRAALEKEGVDHDRVMARLGIALARSGDLDGATIALGQASGTWGDVAAYWSAWVNRSRQMAKQEQPAADVSLQ